MAERHGGMIPGRQVLRLGNKPQIRIVMASHTANEHGARHGRMCLRCWRTARWGPSGVEPAIVVGQHLPVADDPRTLPTGQKVLTQCRGV